MATLNEVKRKPSEITEDFHHWLYGAYQDQLAIEDALEDGEPGSCFFCDREHSSAKCGALDLSVEKNGWRYYCHGRDIFEARGASAR